MKNFLKNIDLGDVAEGYLEGTLERLEKKEALAQTARTQAKTDARRNVPLIGKRRALAKQASTYGNQAKALGATEKQIAIALNSGFDGIQKFVTGLQAAANQRGMTSLGEADIDALFDMPDLPDVNFDYDDMYKAVYGAVPTTAKAPERSLMQRAFGAAKNDDLATDVYAEGLTVQQINDMAVSDEFNQIPGFEGSFVNYKEKPFMDDVEGINFVENYQKAFSDFKKKPSVIAEEKRLEYAIEVKVKEKTAELANAKAENIPEKIAQYKNALRKDAAKVLTKDFRSTMMPVVAGYSSKYGDSFYKNSAVKGWLTNLFGSDWVGTQIKANNTDVNSQTKTIIDSKGSDSTELEIKESLPEVKESDAEIVGEGKETIIVGGKPKVITPFTEQQKTQVKDYLEGRYPLTSHMDTRFSTEYTRADWKLMTRKERDKAGLPTSSIGSWNFEFRDELEEAINPGNLEASVNGSLSFFANPQENASYKIKIKGRLGAYKIKAVDLSDIPVERIRNGDVTIDKITDDGEGLKTKGSSWIKRTLGGA
jgi:hypothetical protein